MNNRQAIKEAIKWGHEVRKRYIFGSNAYRRGMETEAFMRESDRVAWIDETIGVLEQLSIDLDTIHRVLELMKKDPTGVSPEWKQLELFK